MLDLRKACRAGGGTGCKPLARGAVLLVSEADDAAVPGTVTKPAVVQFKKGTELVSCV
jgi:hypothetical protein